MLRYSYIALVFGALLSPCGAEEMVYLKSGSLLQADSHTQLDQTFVFRIGAGTLELATDQVTRIEVLPSQDLSRTAANSSKDLDLPEQILNHAAIIQGLDEDFVRSVARVESGLRQQAISPKGAIGLMQLMPSTAAQLGVHADQAPDNARGGAMFLRDLLIRYHGNSALALAAYNAGPEAVARFHGIPPYPETQRYIVLVLREYERQKAKTRTASAASAPVASLPHKTSATN